LADAAQAWEGVESAGVTEVLTETWETLVSTHPKLADSCFNTLVLDTQGAELEILTSIENSRSSSIAVRGLEQFNYIFVEVSNREFYRGQTLQPSLEAFLQARGFVNVRKEYPVHGDVLYVHRNRTHSGTYLCRDGGGRDPDLQ